MMNFPNRCALTSVVAAMLAGCGGSQPPIAIPQTSTVAPHTDRSKSWTPSDVKTKELLYSSSTFEGTVLMFTYPTGTLVQTLTGFQAPVGLCSDKKGNVFVVDLGAQSIVEFAHGGTQPIATLDDSGRDPNGCSIDPSTGNLAVVGGGVHSGANAAVFSGEQGEPTVYTDGFLSLLAWCTYDNDGNLFAEGYATGSANPSGTILELPAGKSEFTRLSLNQKIGAGGAVQWDGNYLAVGSPRGTGRGLHGPAVIYRFHRSLDRAEPPSTRLS